MPSHSQPRKLPSQDGIVPDMPYMPGLGTCQNRAMANHGSYRNHWHYFGIILAHGLQSKKRARGAAPPRCMSAQCLMALLWAISVHAKRQKMPDSANGPRCHSAIMAFLHRKHFWLASSGQMCHDANMPRKMPKYGACSNCGIELTRSKGPRKRRFCKLACKKSWHKRAENARLKAARAQGARDAFKDIG